MHMRKNVPDSPEFLKAKAEVKEEDHTPVKELFLRYKKSIITVIGLLVGSSATYYILITYMPTYISQFMGTSFSSAFIVNTSVIAINLLLCPVVGMLIDKVGKAEVPDRRLPRVPYLVLSGVLHFDSADQRRLDDRFAGDTHRIPDDFGCRHRGGFG